MTKAKEGPDPVYDSARVKCVACGYKFLGHLTGKCKPCRMRECETCKKRFEPKPESRKLCLNCYRRAMRGNE